MMTSSSGLRLLRITDSRMREAAMTASSTMSIMPYPAAPFARNSATMYKTVQMSFVRGSSRWTTVLPGKNCPSVTSLSMARTSLPELQNDPRTPAAA